MHAERLQHLNTILAGVQPRHLDLDTWVCGSTACAIGWAARDPLFIWQGLSLVPTDDRLVLRPQLDYRDGTTPLVNWAAVEAFFDLTKPQALHLFSPSRYEGHATPADVIRRIDELLAEA